MLVWKGHKAKLRSLVFAPDGQRIATTAGDSKFVWLWESTTGKLIRKLSDVGDAMRLAAFFPDGRHIASVHERRRISIFDTETGALVSTLQSKVWLYSEAVTIHPNGLRLVGATTEGLAEWDEPARLSNTLRDCDRLHPSGGTGYAGQIGFSPAGSYFWRKTGHISLYNAASYTLRHSLTDPDGASATAVAFSQDEKRVCVAFGHRAVIWTPEQPGAKPVKLRGHKQQVRAVGFLPGGNTVLTAAMDGTVRLWDANTGAETRSFDWGIGKVRVAAVSPDGTMCAAGSDDGRLVVWDVDT